MTTETKSRKGIGGRPRKGTLELRGGTWHARITVTEDGVTFRKWIDLETDNRAKANRKLKNAVIEAGRGGRLESVKREATRNETFREATTRIIHAQRDDDGLKTWKERLSRIERYALNLIGDLAPHEIEPDHLEDVFKQAAVTLAKQSVVHLRNDLSTVFKELWRKRAIPENPLLRVVLPKKMRKDQRRRVLLNDPEFVQFMGCAAVSAVLRLKALSSRTMGGQRTSDLHAWDWSHFDLATWESAKVYRPKTQGEVGEFAETELVQLQLPEPLRTLLFKYWEERGKPNDGPVFPVLKGKRAGERQTKRSHARELRDGLWLAGVHRPIDESGFAAAMVTLHGLETALASARAAKAKGEVRELQRARTAAELAAQALDAIQTDTPRTLCADFHSFRRAFNTALADVGLNVQEAMALAGHKSPTTHMRYVDLAQRRPLVMPEGSVPLLPVLPRIWTKLTDSVGASNHETPVFLGDSSENRTRVTGVRGQCPNR